MVEVIVTVVETEHDEGGVWPVTRVYRFEFEDAAYINALLPSIGLAAVDGGKMENKE